MKEQQKPFVPSAPINPASAVLPYLPTHLTFIADDDSSNTTKPTPATAINISIQTHPQIRVSYAAVSALIPELYAHKEFDYVIHIGMMSRPNDSAIGAKRPLRYEYHLETCAKSGMYNKSDVDGRLPAPSSSARDNDEEVHVLSPKGVDFSDVLLRWRRGLSVEDIHGEVGLRLSNDAGLYLCEYIYYSSLRHFARIGSKGSKDDADTKVVFLHVPDDAHKDDLLRAKQVVVGLVKALIGSDLTRRHEVDVEELESSGDVNQSLFAP